MSGNVGTVGSDPGLYKCRDAIERSFSSCHTTQITCIRPV